MKIISNPPQATVFGRFLLSLQALSREGPGSLVLDHSLKLVRHTVTRRRKRFILPMAGTFFILEQCHLFTCSNMSVFCKNIGLIERIAALT